MNVKLETKNFLKLLQLVMSIILYLHLTGCLWFWLVSVDKVWIPPLDFVDINADFYAENLKHQYI